MKKMRNLVPAFNSKENLDPVFGFAKRYFQKQETVWYNFCGNSARELMHKAHFL